MEYAEVDQDKHGQQLAPCPLCGSRAGIWQVTHGSGVVQKAAMCSHGESAEPLGLITSCPMSLPDAGFFYESTYRAAAKVWNDFAAACDARRAPRLDSFGRDLLVQELAMTVRMLCRQLKMHDPDSKLVSAAMDFQRRHGLASPLREGLEPKAETEGLGAEPGKPGGEATRPAASATPAAQGLTDEQINAEYERRARNAGHYYPAWAAFAHGARFGYRAALSAPEQAAQQADAKDAALADEQIAAWRSVCPENGTSFGLRDVLWALTEGDLSIAEAQHEIGELVRAAASGTVPVAASKKEG